MRARAVRALLRKEWRQHAGAILILTVLVLASWSLGWLMFTRDARPVSPLQMVPGFVFVFAPAAAFVLGHRLVVAEYYGRTQRFLEALPIRRGTEALVKAAFGFGVLLGLTLLALGLTLALAASREPIDARYVAVACGRVAGYVFLLWAAVFLTSALGRLRYPLFLLAIILLMAVRSGTEVSVSEIGPLSLVDFRQVAITGAFPWRGFLATVAFGMGLIAVTVWLIRMREGFLMERLARKLSSREKVALSVFVAGALLLLGALEDRQRVAMPVAPEAFVMTRTLKAGSIEVSHLSDELAPAARDVLAFLAPRLERVAAALAEASPRVRLIHGGDVLPARPQLTAIYPGQGVIARFNLAAFAAGASDAHGERAMAEVLHHVVTGFAGSRVMSEPRHWLVDGFTLHVAALGEPAAQGAILQAALLARAAGRAQSLQDQLTGFHSLIEAVGEFPAAALAATGWRVLQERGGAPAVDAVARAAFHRRGTDDVRDYLVDRWQSKATLLSGTGLDWANFLAAWTTFLDTAPAAARIVGPQARLEVKADADGIDPVIVAGQLASPLGPDEICSVLHKLEPHYDVLAPPDALDEDRLLLQSDGRSFRQGLEGDYDRGERVFWAVECRTRATPWGHRLQVGRLAVP